MSYELCDLIFFIHVPKTAGSTVNHYLENKSNNGFSHCESFINQEEILRGRVDIVDWLSGHVNYEVARNAIEAITDRKIKFYSCMREPKEQVISHFNWLIEIGYKSNEFFYSHPINIQNISFEIRASDLNNKYSVMNILTKYRGLFLNSQARTILGRNLTNDRNVIRKILSEYEFIGTNKSLDILINRVVGENSASTIKKNVSTYHFDTSLFDDEEIDYFLKVHNGIDSLLYKLVGDIFNNLNSK